MKKVLLISFGNCFGGIEKIQEEIKNNISNDYSVDILRPKDLNTDREGLINKIKYHFRLSEYLKNNKYDIVHINSSAYLTSFEIVMICKKRKIKKIITHSHDIPKYNLIKRILKSLTCFIYVKNVNNILAVSEKTIDSLVTKKYRNKATVVENGININKYKYNDRIRKELRDKYNLNDKKVYGTVGRFVRAKNHLFLIDLFYEIQKKQDNAFLVIVGEGFRKNMYIDRITELGINDKVLIINYQDNIYNMLDCYIMPSISEGFGISLVEAETNGLICFCTNTIPKESRISAHVFSLDDNKEELANRIIKTKDNNSRKDAYKRINLDIKTMIKKIEKIYK